MKKYIFILLLFLNPVVYAQNINPGPGKIYKEDEVAIIRITMDPADKAFMLDDANMWSDVYLPANLSFKNSAIDTTLAFQVGIRLRGNTSRSKPKKSFKIKFKEFGGQKFFDLKKFNLKAEVNDPSLVREMLTLRAFRNMNVPAARTHHAEVYINGEYMGVYLNVEQIDDEFVQARFVYDAGNIYKCYWGANLLNDGQIYDEGIYELETNKLANDRSVLANFVKVLNTTPSSSFEEELEKVFDVDRFIRYLAVEVLTGHWDAYSYNKNNFYLYENDTTGLVEFIAYDTDNTFGLDWVNRDWGTRNVLDWPNHGDARPLTTKILSRPRYLERYKIYLDQMLKGDFSVSYYDTNFTTLENMLADAVSRDTYYPLSFEYTNSDFPASFDMSVVGHDDYGLRPFVQTRTTSARDQIGVILGLEELGTQQISIYPNPVSGGSMWLQTERPVKEVKITSLTSRQQDFNLVEEHSGSYQLHFQLQPGVYVVMVDGTVTKFLVR